VLLACAGSVQKSQPETPAQAPAPAHPPTLELAPALTALQLGCRSSELPRDNALDDDCDGVIDHWPKASSLTVAWADAGDGELTVKLLDGQKQAISPVDAATPSACTPDHGAATGHVSYDALPSGTHTLVLGELRPCGEPKPVTVALSFATQGSTKAYLVKLEPGQELALGTLTVP
jgi:hypothetical protein